MTNIFTKLLIEAAITEGLKGDKLLFHLIIKQFYSTKSSFCEVALFLNEPWRYSEC